MKVANMARAEVPPLRYVCVFYASNRHHLDLGFEAANRNGRRVSVDNSFTHQSDERLSLGVAKVSVPNFRSIAEQDEDGQENPLRDFAALDLTPSNNVAGFEEVVRHPPAPEDCSSGPGTSAARGAPLLYVHGWRARLSDALDRAAQLAVDLGREGPVIAFDWPSDVGYGQAEAEEKTAQGRLHTVVKMISDATERRVDVVAHSMGARILFDSLLHWTRDSEEPDDARTMLQSVVLAAPDIGLTEFEAGMGPVRRLVAADLTVYCAFDYALGTSALKHVERRLGFCLNAPRRLGSAEFVAVKGPTADFYSHSYFLSAPEMLLDMGTVLRRGTGIEDGRTRTIELR